MSLLDEGRTLDKKGTISLTPGDVRDRQDRDLATYAQVRQFFFDRYGRSLFLLYGSLLGLHRDGDLIPTDDDFDAGYVLDKTDPVAVKEETKEIVFELVQAGFTVSFNRRGRLFRVQLSNDGDSLAHIDVHPIWFQGGTAWAHNLLCIAASRDDFLPARLADDPHLWATALFDEGRALGYEGAYSSFTRGLRVRESAPMTTWPP